MRVAAMTGTVREQFAARLEQAMRESGYTDLRELGARLGLTAQAVRKWRDADAIPSAEHAPRLAAVLGVRRAWLLDGELPMRLIPGVADRSGNYASEESSISPDEFRLLCDLRGLPHEVRDSFVQLVETIKGVHRRQARVAEK
jgi:transcriptional regulator with XRE-family HTH domain